MFGERLAELRKLNDDTQQILADKIGFSVWAVRAWEQEKNLPPSDALLAICKLYGTSGTCAWLNKHMVPCNEVRNMSGEAPNIVDLLQSGLVDYVFSTSAKGRDPKRDSVRLRRKAVELSIPCITAVDTANALVNCLRSDHSMKDIPLVDIATLYHKK